MEHSRVALPELSYLARVGEVAYFVSSLEWLVLGDLHRFAADLPTELSLTELEPQTTGGIATKIKAAIPKIDQGPTKEYLTAAYHALCEASRIRNDVLHARPATDPDDRQRLLRAETVNRETTGRRVWIDDAWFDEALRKLNALLTTITEVRPPFS